MLDEEDPIERRWRRIEITFFFVMVLLILAVTAVLMGWIQPRGV